MIEEYVRTLDADALELFERKGAEGGKNVPQAGRMNGVKVRRVIQATRDFTRRPFAQLRILDLGCGEGVYAIEAGLRGAEVVALDVRSQRMEKGRACAERHGLDKVRFVQMDARRVTRETFGTFDVVYLLGLLYHLDAPDVFVVLENIHGLCAGLLVVETLISPAVEREVEWRGRAYQGRSCREHEDGDSDEIRRSRVLRSLDNTLSFHFTRESLFQAIHGAGFTSVFECHVPFEPGKPGDRITLVCIRGEPVVLSTYPWVNDKSESEIERIIQSLGGTGA